MQPQLRISPTVQELLRCPRCHAKLKHTGPQFECTNSECQTLFPIVDGIPVLINERSSVFSCEDFVSHRKTFFSSTRDGKLKKTVRRLLPTLSKNIKGRKNYGRLSDLLLKQLSSPRILVLGGSILGQGMEDLANNTALDLVESDVAFGPRIMLICDAHDIPFENGSFDGVIIQAVLEHVADPYRCVEEIHRVLNDQGVVYAETPFMQQVHGGRYDFTRFTHLGHRRLFRRFDEIDSGAVCGPGMALAWSCQYFLLSFTTSKTLRAVIEIFTHLTSFYLKYFDHYLIDKPGALDAASGYYFMGRKGTQVLSDQDLIKLYKGAG
ncbi:MAG: methyltransferase domain-containing protein [Verrucomicrobia bacterium]|nr:methyltransferase domain-containing protein [Verrucomicrobiota bacterium]